MSHGFFGVVAPSNKRRFAHSIRYNPFPFSYERAQTDSTFGTSFSSPSSTTTTTITPSPPPTMVIMDASLFLLELVSSPFADGSRGYERAQTDSAFGTSSSDFSSAPEDGKLFSLFFVGWLSSLQFCLSCVLFVGCVSVFHHCKYWLVVIFAILSFVCVVCWLCFSISPWQILVGCHLCNFVFGVSCLLAVFQYFTIANIGWLSSLQFCLSCVLFVGCVSVFHHCKYWLVVIFAICLSCVLFVGYVQCFTIANIGWLSSLQFCLLFVLFIGCVLVFHHCKYWLVVIFAILSFVFVSLLQILSICLFVVSCL